MVQPKPKQMSREEKEEKVAEFKRKIEDYPVIGVLDMQSLPSRQLQQMKKEMKEFADIKMSRKTLMQIAIEKAEKDDIEQLEDNEAVQPAFIFSDKDPFQLYSLIKKNKTSAAAQGGETSPSDIEVPEGDTGIGPGPMLGKLQQTGAQVQVEDGSIHVMQSATMIEKGDTITADDAEILNQLGIEPLEIGLDLDIAFSDGEIFTAEQLDIDEEEYRDNIESAAGLAFNLAVNAGIVNERTAGTIVGEAAQKGRNLSISEGIPTEDTIEEILAHASSNAEGLDSQVDTEDVDLEESEEPEEPEDSGEESEDEDDDNDSEEAGDSDSSEEEKEE